MDLRAILIQRIEELIRKNLDYIFESMETVDFCAFWVSGIEFQFFPHNFPHNFPHFSHVCHLSFLSISPQSTSKFPLKFPPTFPTFLDPLILNFPFKSLLSPQFFSQFLQHLFTFASCFLHFRIEILFSPPQETKQLVDVLAETHSLLSEKLTLNPFESLMAESQNSLSLYSFASKVVTYVR